MCMKSGPNGSCPLPAVEGSLFCEKHSSDAQLAKAYILDDTNLQKYFNLHADNLISSLRDEVALLRAMANDRLNMARTEADKIVAYQQVGGWFATIDKLVNSLNRLEKEASLTLTKDTLLEIARKIVEVISEELPNDREDVVDAIAVRIIPLVEDAVNVR